MRIHVAIMGNRVVCITFALLLWMFTLIFSTVGFLDEEERADDVAAGLGSRLCEFGWGGASVQTEL